MSTDIQIFNRALLSLSELVDQVTAVDGSDTSANGKIAGMIYAKTREEEIRRHNWIFAIKRVTAVISVVTNNTGWAYAYDIPSDSLRIIGVYVQDAAVRDPENDHEGEVFYRFKEEKAVVYCNAPSLSPNPFFKYIEKITDPTKFDPNFEEMFICRLAAKMCKAVTGDDDQKKEIQAEYGALLVRAQTVNAIEKEDDHEGEGEAFWFERRP